MITMYYNKELNLDSLEEQLKIDEGVRYEVYLDHLGYPTFGIGHLICENDPEYKCPVGTKVSEERVAEVFRKDLVGVLEDCEILYKNIWDGFPGEVKEICANMMFNLGRTRLTKFQNMRLALAASSWKLAAIEMQDSKWYYQVGDRAKRLVKRMSSID